MRNWKKLRVGISSDQRDSYIKCIENFLCSIFVRIEKITIATRSNQIQRRMIADIKSLNRRTCHRDQHKQPFRFELHLLIFETNEILIIFIHLIF